MAVRHLDREEPTCKRGSTFHSRGLDGWHSSPGTRLLTQRSRGMSDDVRKSTMAELRQESAELRAWAQTLREQLLERRFALAVEYQALQWRRAELLRTLE